MGDPVTINIRHLSRGLAMPLGQVQAVLELLDEGNTVPFITRYRRDQTGGLDEEKIREIQDRLGKLRLLSERKQTILRSIESQGKLTEDLEKRIRSANTAKRLEDLYLPYKPKKQTLAQLARSRGLETLADEIALRSPNCSDLDRRAADFANPDRGVPTAAEALLGAGHILAERISENVELRQSLREIMQRSGRIVSCRVGSEEKATDATLSARPQRAASPPPVAGAPKPIEASPAPATETADPSTATQTALQAPSADDMSVSTPASVESDSEAVAEAGVPQAIEPAESAAEMVEDAAVADETPSDETPQPDETRASKSAASADISFPPNDDQQGSGMGGGPDNSIGEEPSPIEEHQPAQADVSGAERETAPAKLVTESPAGPEDVEPARSSSEQAPPDQTMPAQPTAEQGAAEAAPIEPPVGENAASGVATGAAAAVVVVPPSPSRSAPKRKGSRKSSAERKAERKRQKKQKTDEKKQKAFSDYFDYSEDLRKIPPHRVLAINRGERGKVLRVKIDCDQEAMTKVAEDMVVAEDHPHLDFLKGCARDALARLILPSLERETRRELTERAESHAVGVFAKNLRNLLLQPPVHNRRVLAVDPGFKSGCKLVALDQFGNVLAQALIYLIGKPERKEESENTVKELMERFKLTVVAIGNGTACRDAEDFFGEILKKAPEGSDWAYVIVNEAGASVYSTSSVGREEFPEYDATVRGAISIGRRLQDPLSELVKIDPANIGVGLYQHDVKAKHLRESLDDVVSSCVNYVGVDVNTASPALLRYVSGLNQLTARRVYEHRMQHGPFRNREQLRSVTGFGGATFVQSAGFLKIGRGDNPLDSSWIHPESYAVALRVLDQLGFQVDDLRSRDALKGLAEKVAAVDAGALAKELGVGELLLKDILAQLVRPGRDPREDLPPPIFRHGVLKLEDLTPGLELSGTVLNVVDFGVFVDIGMHDSGLVHVSQLADKFVRDPHEVAAVGDVVKVWVLDVDKQRRRVSLTMISPGTPRAGAHREERGDRHGGGRPESARQVQMPRDQQSGPSEAAEGGRGHSREAGHGRDAGRARDTGRGRDGGRGRDAGRGRDGGRGRGRSQEAPAYKPKSRPKPIKPITDEMKEGREPMRSFSDLAQFFGTTQVEPEPPKKQTKRKDTHPGSEKANKPDSEPKSSTDTPPRADETSPPPTDAEAERPQSPASGGESVDSIDSAMPEETQRGDT